MEYSDLVYNAKNSLFMYRLCNDGSDKTDNLTRSMIIRESEYIIHTIEQDQEGKDVDILKNKLPSIYKKPQIIWKCCLILS